MDLGLGRCRDEMEETKLHVSSRESSRRIFLQVLPSYLLAGLGMVTAGMLLDHVQVSESPPNVKECKEVQSHLHQKLHSTKTKNKTWKTLIK